MYALLHRKVIGAHEPRMHKALFNIRIIFLQLVLLVTYVLIFDRETLSYISMYVCQSCIYSKVVNQKRPDYILSDYLIVEYDYCNY